MFKEKIEIGQVHSSQPIKSITWVMNYIELNYFFYYIIKKYKTWSTINSILDNKIIYKKIILNDGIKLKNKRSKKK
jgi:hypothetical protein